MDADTPVAEKMAKARPTRAIAVVAVVLLIIVAIAGILLARKNASPVTVGAPAISPTAAIAPSLGASTPQAPVEPTPGPNDVMFDAGSDRLPASASETITKFSDSSRGKTGIVRVTARFPTGPTKASDIELAKKRFAAVRHALEANGVKMERMQSELMEMPAGEVTRRQADLIELSLH